eukprot:8160027-Karenia_brevis.AAC.1
MEVLAKHGVIQTYVNMCAYGMTSVDEQGMGYVYKPTKFMTNSPAIAEQLNRKCSNQSQANKHRHIHLMNGRAKKAQIYPTELCRAICKGLKNQKDWDEEGKYLIGTIESDNDIHEELKRAMDTAQGAHEGDIEAYDDVSGAVLNPDMVRKARLTEMEYFRRMKVYKKVSLSKCWATTGKKPIAVRWIDVNKQDEVNPKYRSRLVAKQFKTYNDPDLFAATPPLEAMKIIISCAATRDNVNQRLLNKIM